MHNNYKITFNNTEHVPKEYLINSYIRAESCTRIIDQFEIEIWNGPKFVVPYKDVKEIK